MKQNKTIELEDCEIPEGIYFIHPTLKRKFYLTKKRDGQNFVFSFENRSDGLLLQNQLFYFYKNEEGKSYTIFTISNPHCIGIQRQNNFLNEDIIPHELSFLNSCRWKLKKQSNENNNENNNFYFELQENKLFIGEKRLKRVSDTFDSDKIALQTIDHATQLTLKKVENVQRFFDDENEINECIERINKMKTRFMKKELQLEGKFTKIKRVDMLFCQNLKKISIDCDVKNIEQGSFDHLNIETIECSLDILKKHFSTEKHKKSIKEIKLLYIESLEDLNLLDQYVNLKTIEIDKSIHKLDNISNPNIRHILKPL